MTVVATTALATAKIASAQIRPRMAALLTNFALWTVFGLLTVSGRRNAAHTI
ncbi:MAG: hypothetical protein AAGJ94_15015 [Pseudomonadota bacterium]